MKSIVVPVNFTACAANAAHYAADMALAMEADVHLLHVVQIPAIPAEVPVGYIFDDMENNAKGLLKTISEDLVQRTKGQVTVNVNIEIGGLEFKIEEFCKRIKPFVVVMGTPGDPYARLLSGSDTVHAMHHLPYPLLVVPPKAVFRAIRKVAIACELAEIRHGMPVSLAFLKGLKDLFAARFDIINVATEKADGKDKAVFELYRWKELLKELVPELHFIDADSVEDGIDNYLIDHAVDWLMVFPKRHGLLEFHKSQSKKIVMHCPVPVISLCEENLKFNHHGTK